MENIISQLDILRQEMVRERNVFKARAYDNVIKQLRHLPADVALSSADDLIKAGITGIGEKIHAKIDEIINTGVLQSAEKIKNDPGINLSLYQDLLKVYGIGPVKAKSLTEHKNIHSITDLKTVVQKEPRLLNEKQKIGLKYYEDIQKRIPRDEIRLHEALIRRVFKKSDDRFIITIVGSYRRGAVDSGDIDVLITWPRYHDNNNNRDQDFTTASATVAFHRAIDIFKTVEKYIPDVLALGDKKCLAVCRLAGSDARRIDMLLTPPDEYPFALLYFTGSDKFNIQFRKKVLEQGYTLNEHGYHSLANKNEESGSENPETATNGKINSEKDIFDRFGIPYRRPEER